MDIRHYIDNLKKQSINFVEVLFTQYCIVNSKYKDIWNNIFLRYKEGLARYDVRKGVASMTGQALNTLRQSRTNGKKVGNAYRILESLHCWTALYGMSSIIRVH